jgi:copper chaperone CopZ
MRLLRIAALVSCALLITALELRADTKVVVKDVHICCPQCAKMIVKAEKTVGVHAIANVREKTVTLEAPDDQTAQKGLDALVEAGFYGRVSSPTLQMKDTSGVKQGKVESLSLGGAHNCCRACANAIKETLKNTNGVTSDTVAPRSQSFTVTGNFDAADIVKALHDAGFSVKVEK